MFSRRFVLFYVSILVLAFFLRLFRLGDVPLSDYEATWALQALGLARGERPLLGSQTAYHVPAALLFFVFGASNFAARFWPALVGVLLLLVPWLLRGQIGDRAALILTLGLTMDPALWALSRLAGGPMLAVTFLTLTVALWRQRRYALGGACAGLALLAGPSVWFGALTLMAAGLVYVWRFRAASGAAEAEDAPRGRFVPPRLSLRAAWPWTLGVLLFLGTSFGFFPHALGAAAGALPEFLRGWWTPSDVSAWQPVLALLADEALPLLFGLIAAVRGFVRKDQGTISLALWALIAFALTLLYPGRQVGDLLWTIVPLWILAAPEIDRHLRWEDVDRRAVLLVAVVTLMFLMLTWFLLAPMTVSGWVDGGLFQQPALPMAIGVLVFLIVTLVMVGFGWDGRTAQRGGLWGLLAALYLAALGAGTSATGLRHPPTVSLWQPSPTIAQADLLRLTIAQVSNWSRGHAARLSLRIAELDSAALRWLLRDYEVEVLQAVNVGDRIDAILTPEASLAPQEDGYRGQDFLWRQTPRWEVASVLDWLRWGLFRTMPQESETIILWVRPDLTFMEQENGNAEHYRD